MERKLRLAKLHCAGMDFWGYLARGEDESRTRHNTWNGWECPVLDKKQLLEFIDLQNWRVYEGENVDLWEYHEKDDKWGVTIIDTYSSMESDTWHSFEVETDNGETIEVVSTPCYCFESGWGNPDETYNVEEYHKKFPDGITQNKYFQGSVKRLKKIVADFHAEHDEE